MRLIKEFEITDEVMKDNKDICIAVPGGDDCYVPSMPTIGCSVCNKQGEMIGSVTRIVDKIVTIEIEIGD